MTYSVVDYHTWNDAMVGLGATHSTDLTNSQHRFMQHLRRAGPLRKAWFSTDRDDGGPIAAALSGVLTALWLAAKRAGAADIGSILRRPDLSTAACELMEKTVMESRSEPRGSLRSQVRHFASDFLSAFGLRLAGHNHYEGTRAGVWAWVERELENHVHDRILLTVKFHRGYGLGDLATRPMGVDPRTATLFDRWYGEASLPSLKQLVKGLDASCEYSDPGNSWGASILRYVDTPEQDPAKISHMRRIGDPTPRASQLHQAFVEHMMTGGANRINTYSYEVFNEPNLVLSGIAERLVLARLDELKRGAQFANSDYRYGTLAARLTLIGYTTLATRTVTLPARWDSVGWHSHVLPEIRLDYGYIFLRLTGFSNPARPGRYQAAGHCVEHGGAWLIDTSRLRLFDGSVAAEAVFDSDGGSTADRPARLERLKCAFELWARQYRWPKFWEVPSSIEILRLIG